MFFSALPGRPAAASRRVIPSPWPSISNAKPSKTSSRLSSTNAMKASASPFGPRTTAAPTVSASFVSFQAQSRVSPLNAARAARTAAWRRAARRSSGSAATGAPTQSVGSAQNDESHEVLCAGPGPVKSRSVISRPA